ncbi:MAG: 7-carboxy-7-deazaguanine synthase QueE [Chloroflexi bacterium]|nr:7-carboxy-7-deazaguanine synthase QueE [Chloroflexota bacterium]
MPQSADLIEIFDSFQGEGTLLGVRQLFLRFAGCNRNCIYCDTKKDPSDRGYSVEGLGSIHGVRFLPNPVSKTELLDVVKAMFSHCHHSISLTGGEPLLQANFLAEFLPDIAGLNIPVYLETNGTLPDELEEVLTYIDYIAMDIKLPSATGEKLDWNDTERFLKLSRSKQAMVKMVITGSTDLDEILMGAEMVSNISPETPLIIQPVTMIGKGYDPPDIEQIGEIHDRLSKFVRAVRVIPQVHRVLGAR